jgi:hypothetical protein
MKFNIKKIIIGSLLLTAFLGATSIYLDARHSKQAEQKFYDRFNQIPDNPSPEDVLGLSLANLSIDEEKEIQEIVQKSFEGQHLYRFCHKSEEEMDKSIENLYVPNEYQTFKEEYKKENELWCEVSLEDTLVSLEKIRFSKIWKYKSLENRVGIVAGPESGNVHSFLFKKIDNQWKIEKEKWPMIKYYFDEHLAARELIEQNKDILN